MCIYICKWFISTKMSGYCNYYYINIIIIIRLIINLAHVQMSKRTIKSGHSNKDHIYIYIASLIIWPHVFKISLAISIPIIRSFLFWLKKLEGLSPENKINILLQPFNLTRTSWRSAPLVLVPVSPNVSHNPSC